MSNMPLPVTERHCPKCNHDKAYGPEYRRGLKGDFTLGEHLRFYCAQCRYMTVEPTKDQDTAQRRRELAEAFEERRREWAEHGDRSFVPKHDPRDRDIESVRRADTRGEGAPYGWRR